MEQLLAHESLPVEGTQIQVIEPPIESSPQPPLASANGIVDDDDLSVSSEEKSDEE